MFLTKRLLLSGNPLDCICENYWIKSRLLEEPDGQDLTCTDDRGASQAFITLTPPDCGMWSTALIPHPVLEADLEAGLEADLGADLEADLKLLRFLVSCSGSQSGGVPQHGDRDAGQQH